jgi:ankyrin repeat protein
LRLSARYGRLEVVQFLVENGANIHSLYDDALIWSACRGHLSVVQYLVSIGAYSYTAKDRALHWSAMNGHLSVVNCLILSDLQYYLNHEKWHDRALEIWAPIKRALDMSKRMFSKHRHDSQLNYIIMGFIYSTYL